MPNHVAQMFEKRGVPVIVACLYRLNGQSVEMVVRDPLFQQHVLEPCWAQLSAPLRLIGQPRLRWEEFFGAIRREAFEVKEGRLALRKDIHAFLTGIIGRLFQNGDPGAAPAPGGRAPAAPAAKSAAESPATKSASRPSQKKDAASSGAESAKPTPPAKIEAALPIGIDLGTTYSVIAYIDNGGRPVSIPNAAGEILTPSVVLFDAAGPVVGKEAVLASALEPERVVECVKRDMGQKAFHRPINGEDIPPEVISSFILRNLKADAERKLGTAISQAVITVPAFFDETRRRATMDAGRLAGLDVLDIINEPTAAAIAYGYQLNFLDPKRGAPPGKPLRVVVFDLGGGTFDVTIVQIDGTHFKALATDGDVYLGGKDWDAKLIDIACDRFITTHHQDPRTHPGSLQELSVAVEVAKKTLSERPRAKLVVNHLGTRLMVEISREEFEERTAPLLARTRGTTEIVIRQAGLKWSDIDQILLVGGATRMPMIGRMLSELSGKEPSHSVSADEAVAHGAALYADLVLRQRAGQPTTFAVTNVNSHSLGLIGTDPSTGSKRCRILIPKNTPLPHAVSRYFRTLRRSQRSVAVRVVEGESDEPEHCTAVGTCAITGLPANLPQGSSVLVQYAYQSNGRLRVTAKLKDHPVGVTTEFQRNNCLPDDALKLWTEYVNGESER